jgi:hypothetical protein
VLNSKCTSLQTQEIIIYPHASHDTCIFHLPMGITLMTLYWYVACKYALYAEVDANLSRKRDMPKHERCLIALDYRNSFYSEVINGDRNTTRRIQVVLLQSTKADNHLVSERSLLELGARLRSRINTYAITICLPPSSSPCSHPILLFITDPSITTLRPPPKWHPHLIPQNPPSQPWTKKTQPS